MPAWTTRAACRAWRGRLVPCPVHRRLPGRGRHHRRARRHRHRHRGRAARLRRPVLDRLGAGRLGLRLAPGRPGLRRRCTEVGLGVLAARRARLVTASDGAGPRRAARWRSCRSWPGCSAPRPSRRPSTRSAGWSPGRARRGDGLARVVHDRPAWRSARRWPGVAIDPGAGGGLPRRRACSGCWSSARRRAAATLGPQPAGRRAAQPLSATADARSRRRAGGPGRSSVAGSRPAGGVRRPSR